MSQSEIPTPEPKKFDVKEHLPSAWFVATAGIGAAMLVTIVTFSGLYNIGADSPHTPPVYWLVEQFRDRSIAARSQGLTPPADLSDPTRIAEGAALYSEMCISCHLAPGMGPTELSRGLYPAAPVLGEARARSEGEKFWIIKHGIKLTAMPAWGATHTDDQVWNLVAFTGALPAMSREQYDQIVASAPADHDEMMEDMPGMDTHDSKASPH